MMNSSDIEKYVNPFEDKSTLCPQKQGPPDAKCPMSELEDNIFKDINLQIHK